VNCYRRMDRQTLKGIELVDAVEAQDVQTDIGGRREATSATVLLYICCGARGESTEGYGGEPHFYESHYLGGR